MSTQQIKQAFTQLGHYLRSDDAQLNELINSAQGYNAWFTPEQVNHAVQALGKMLNPSDIEQWIDSAYVTHQQEHQLVTVGLVLAGNIPLVGFHDILTVLASGNKAMIKLSSQDKHLTPHILSRLIEYMPSLQEHIIYADRLKDFDAVIATGSNNTSRYFEYYFKNVPHIIRKNRNSVAVLNGSEAKDDFIALGHDIFDYFGLGCRNVSKLFVPEGYNFVPFFEAIEEPFKNMINHHKYANNYDYNKSIYLVNGEKHLDNGFLLLKQDVSMSSPLAVLFYDTYPSTTQAEEKLNILNEQIQCVVVKEKLDLQNQQVMFGESQTPKLWDYADGVNTFEFLLNYNPTLI
ncbi:acyl-CoA reductase [Arcticibacter eurypsychrophilus]|uniref:acyl-CoA reductase n=1 Tax=Arcticibacter eurypsychrophilus TaxID=1434752 RepID=UPI00084D0B7A|nr:acyl-CoA reductase [Arcticibacter eurypsychrophilus]